MDISTNQLKTVSLEGITPTQKPDVVVVEKQDTVERSDANENSSQVKQESTKEDLQVAVSEINDYVQNIQRSLQFTVDEKSGRDVVTVLDTKTEEIIRQYPTEEVLAFARQLAQQKEEAISLFSSRV
jgi:flagellar protein FlaG